MAECEAVDAAEMRVSLADLLADAPRRVVSVNEV